MIGASNHSGSGVRKQTRSRSQCDRPLARALRERPLTDKALPKTPPILGVQTLRRDTFPCVHCPFAYDDDQRLAAITTCPLNVRFDANHQNDGNPFRSSRRIPIPVLQRHFLISVPVVRCHTQVP
jgi:hypothetical protein